MKRVALLVLLLLLVATSAYARRAEPIDAAALADEVEAAWERHDLRWWFPRVVDPAGGFFQGFDADGAGIARSNGIEGGERTSIYQSRMTWVAATICQRRPELRGEFEPVVRHGLAFIKENLVADDGGLWWGVDADGAPLLNGERHLYNTSFGIYAAAAAERALPGEGGLELALSLLNFLEEHGRSDAFPGYFEHYARDGHAITSADDPAAQGDYATMMPHYGDKSMNAQIHLLEALAELHHADPGNALVERRLRESYAMVADKLYGEPGFLHLYLNADGTPLPNETSYGHNIETAFLLIEAAEALGEEEAAWPKAAKLVDTSLRVAWDQENGGLNDAGSTYEIHERRKDWWVQAEALNAILMMADAARGGHGGDYSEAEYLDFFLKEWAFIDAHLLDQKDGGWFWGVDENLDVNRQQPKAGQWKTSYHTSRALLNVADRLRARAE